MLDMWNKGESEILRAIEAKPFRFGFGYFLKLDSTSIARDPQDGCYHLDIKQISSLEDYEWGGPCRHDAYLCFKALCESSDTIDLGRVTVTNYELYEEAAGTRFNHIYVEYRDGNQVIWNLDHSIFFKDIKTGARPDNITESKKVSSPSTKIDLTQSFYPLEEFVTEEGTHLITFSVTHNKKLNNPMVSIACNSLDTNKRLLPVYLLARRVLDLGYLVKSGNYIDQGVVDVFRDGSWDGTICMEQGEMRERVVGAMESVVKTLIRSSIGHC